MSSTDRGDIENPFSRYMYLHNAVEDERIIPLWVKPGTPGVRARYTNAGRYIDYSPSTRQTPDPVLPAAHDTFVDTFK
ncbi:hypothetical protein LJR078_001857 [Arthrobacter sp. LjRoot78]|uniref:hypothetical protein n=1 Tax=Arthrobacter sp. LjRoot78 TaxID=3342338 RepID=UPI003ECE0378